MRCGGGDGNARARRKMCGDGAVVVVVDVCDISIKSEVKFLGAAYLRQESMLAVPSQLVGVCGRSGGRRQK